MPLAGFHRGVLKHHPYSEYCETILAADLSGLPVVPALGAVKPEVGASIRHTAGSTANLKS